MHLKWVLRAIAFWQKAQVEFHGHYSVDRLARFTEYSKQVSQYRVVGLVLVAPLPCLIANLMFEMIQLKPPEDGAKANWAFWLRMFGLNSLTMLISILLFHRALGLPRLDVFLLTRLTLLANVMPSAAGYGLAQFIGFPVPFIVQLVLPLWLLGAGISTMIVYKPYRHLFSTLKPKAIEYCKISSIPGTLVIIYPVYFYIFRQLSSSYQGMFSLILPAMKIVLKNIMSHFFRLHADLRPEEIVFTIEVFTSLFATFSMQNSTSLQPILLLTGIDIAHACISLYDILSFASILEHSLKEFQMQQSARRKVTTEDISTIENLIEGVSKIALQLDEASQQRIASAAQHRAGYPKQTGPSNRTSIRPRVFGAKLTAVSPAQMPISGTNVGTRTNLMPTQVFVSRKISRNASSECISSQKEKLILQVLRFLHATEYIVLVEFTKVIIPTIYVLYLPVAFRLPNHEFYPQFKGVSSQQQLTLMNSIVIYAAVELVTLIIVSVVVWRRLRFSLFKQLAFVLDCQWRYVEMRLVVWVLYVIQCSLVHFGFDYSFRFKWLHSPTSQDDGEAVSAENAQ